MACCNTCNCARTACSGAALPQPVNTPAKTSAAQARNRWSGRICCIAASSRSAASPCQYLEAMLKSKAIPYAAAFLRRPTAGEQCMSVERPWLAHYPAGVPAEIDMDEFASINDVFESALQKYRDKTAFINM